MNTKIITRIGIGIVIVVLFGLVMKSGLHNSSSPGTSTPTPVAASPAPIVYASVPTNWNVYASASAGFKISYPKNWTEQSCGTGCVAFGATGSTSQPLVGVSIAQTTLADTLTQVTPYQISKDTVSVGAISWTKVVLQEPQSGNIFTSHFVEHGSALYEVGLASQDAETVAIYGQMVHSFVFTK